MLMVICTDFHFLLVWAKCLQEIRAANTDSGIYADVIFI